jgi:hypothetical protein
MPTSRLRSAALAASLGSLLALAGCAGFASGPSSRSLSLSQINAAVQTGQRGDAVYARLGQPTYVFPLPRQGVDVWNYRFAPPEGDCVVFQVSVSRTTGLVTETGQGQDRSCDGPNDRS